MAEKEERAKDLIYVFSQEQVCKMCDGYRYGICDCCAWKLEKAFGLNALLEGK